MIEQGVHNATKSKKKRFKNGVVQNAREHATIIFLGLGIKNHQYKSDALSNKYIIKRYLHKYNIHSDHKNTMFVFKFFFLSVKLDTNT